MKLFRPTVVFFGLLTLLTGVVYPVLVSASAWFCFEHEAGGSLLVHAGSVRGSRLIGQQFTDPAYFWARPSATPTQPYNAGASSGSNLGPSNDALHSAVAARVAALRALDPHNTAAIPVDLVTASGSGLDPHISPASALYQVARVARARGLSTTAVQTLVSAHTEERTFGVLGEARVNVLALNLALDALRLSNSR